MFDLGDLEEQARLIDARYTAELTAISKRDDLTTAAKVDMARSLEAARQNTVTRMQADARQRHAAAMEKAEKEAQAKRAADVQRKRDLLGDAAMLRLAEKRIEAAADGDELLTLIADAAPGYEKELLTELARVSLAERTAVVNPTYADIQAWQHLQPEPDIDYELKRGAQRIEQLDLQAYRTNAADRLGVDSRYVPAPY